MENEVDYKEDENQMNRDSSTAELSTSKRNLSRYDLKFMVITTVLFNMLKRDIAHVVIQTFLHSHFRLALNARIR